MIPGRKTIAIFGFCDIRYFVVATECLQEDIMVFVNKIALIVHGCVHLYGGAANKNIGEAWLLVWKLPKGTSEELLANMNKRTGALSVYSKNPDGRTSPAGKGIYIYLYIYIYIYIYK